MCTCACGIVDSRRSLVVPDSPVARPWGKVQDGSCKGQDFHAQRTRLPDLKACIAGFTILKVISGFEHRNNLSLACSTLSHAVVFNCQIFTFIDAADIKRALEVAAFSYGQSASVDHIWSGTSWKFEGTYKWMSADR